MLKLIMAVSDNNIVGNGDKLAWNIKEELQFFKDTTMEAHLLMGRTTFEGMNKRLLPGRKTFVATSKKDYDANGAEVVNDARKHAELYVQCCWNLYVCGGVSLYNELYELCDEMIISRVHIQAEGDVKGPEIKFDNFDLTKTEKHDKFTVEYWTKKK